MAVKYGKTIEYTESRVVREFKLSKKSLPAEKGDWAISYRNGNVRVVKGTLDKIWDPASGMWGKFRHPFTAGLIIAVMKRKVHVLIRGWIITGPGQKCMDNPNK